LKIEYARLAYKIIFAMLLLLCQILSTVLPFSKEVKKMDALDQLIQAFTYHPKYIPLKTAADMLDAWRAKMAELDFLLNKIDELAGFTVRQSAARLPELMASLDEQIEKVSRLALTEADETQDEHLKASYRAAVRTE
jgi:hypothetical protein